MSRFDDEINKSKISARKNNTIAFVLTVFGFLLAVIYVVYYIEIKQQQQEEQDILISKRDSTYNEIFIQQQRIDSVLQEYKTIIDDSEQQHVSIDTIKKSYKVIQKRIDSISQRIATRAKSEMQNELQVQ